MKVELKPIDQQVVVITGASSGIGLATALAAAERGAKAVLAARSTTALDAIAAQIEAAGGTALAVSADVGRRGDVEGIAEAALARFGRIDSWVNNAGVGIFGRLDEVDDAANQRLFETNFWGVVHGSLVALPHLRAGGGALINIGSELSDAVVPLQGMYTASKHAVKGFTDALRMELAADAAPVSVTLIQPTAVDTPFPDHAGNYLSQEPKLPTPMIEPGKVAAAVLKAATEPVRDIKVGAMAVLDSLIARLVPNLSDVMGRLQLGRQQRNEAPHARAGALYTAGGTGRVHGRGNQNAARASEARETNVRPG